MLIKIQMRVQYYTKVFIVVNKINLHIIYNQFIVFICLSVHVCVCGCVKLILFDTPIALGIKKVPWQHSDINGPSKVGQGI